MRRFILTLVLFASMSLSLMGQHVQLVFVSPDMSDTSVVALVEIDSILDRRLESYAEKGYWDASIQLSQNTSDPEIIEAHLIPGKISVLSHVHFEGITVRDAQYLEKEYKMGHSTISADNLELAQRRINNLGYQLATISQLSMDNERRYHLKHIVENHPELRVQGLASFNQSGSADTLAWYGQVSVHIPNFDGKGKTFDFSWERLKENSESFMLGLQYPWVFQLPLESSVRFGREVIDGNYQILQTSFGLSWDIDWERSIYFSYERNESIITHAGLLKFPEWRADKKQLLGLGYRQSSLNTQKHHGLAIKTTLFQEMNFEPESIRKFKFRSEAQLRLPIGLYFSQRSAATIQNHTIALTDPSILMALGGVNSVRGYEEAAIRAPNVLSMQNTLHYQIGRSSQLLAFYDFGLHNTQKSIKNIQGYGVGIQLRSGSGPIKLILASHKGLKLSNSFFHIEYSGGLPWIDR